ncbi:MAG: methionine--tRNA ligase [Siphonobacter aquaeclarae]|nr:methionine--tRNA ligase [Siphonobacter aquaeclarae]
MPDKKFNRTTVTAALIYANGPIHIGHLAGCYVPADVYVRFLRTKGDDVAFISGTDEHGVPITIRAQKEGITPQEVVDKYYNQINKAFSDFGISFDIYSRTSKQVHHEMSQDIFLQLYNKGKFTEEVTEQYYDEKAGQFLADRYIVGTCPVCGNENAYGDQCERCGSTLSPTELKNPRSMLSGEAPVLKATKNWNLPLDQMQPDLETYVESHPEWKTNVAGQVRSWLKEGLKPRAMTRDLDWGIKVPLPDAEGKVMYVWFDAPIGYITFTKELKGADWEKWWKAEDTRIVHFIGKDNIVFHCLIFPAMLMADGRFIPGADNVPANEFMNLEGDKISTSRNWAVWLHEYLEDMPGKQDVLRYTLIANAPETKDSEFTWKDYQTRNNSELVAILGNFVNRAIVLTEKNFGPAVPARGELTEADTAMLEELALYPGRIAEALENFRFREGLGLFMDVARLGNQYLAATEPWKVLKENPERAATILHLALQLTATLSVLAEPFLPFTAARLREMLHIGPLSWANAGKLSLLEAGQPISNTGLLFEKIEDAVIEAQVQKLLDTKKQNELAARVPAPQKEAITYDDFTKLDIRIATIVAAVPVPKSKKLLQLTLETGLDTRTVVSGIAEHFSPEEIIGKQVSLLANLAPRKMMGIESQGMILMAEDRDGKLQFIRPGEPVWNGASVS